MPRRAAIGNLLSDSGPSCVFEMLESRVLLSGSAPIVSTRPALQVSMTGATLVATVNASGSSTSASFEYSTDPSFPPTSVVNTYSAGFGRPTGVVLDAAGDVFVADYQDPQIREILPNGTIQSLGPNFIAPEGIALDASGDIYVGDALASSIKEIMPGGATQAIGSGFSYPSGVAVDSAGDVFVADSAHNAIKKILPNGSINTIGSGFNNPYAVAVNSSGDIFVADYGNNAAKEILPDGTTITLATGISEASGIAVDAHGDVFVSAHGVNEEKEIEPDGNVLTLGSGWAGNAGQAVNAAGDLYVGNQFDSDVVEMAPTSLSASPSSLSSSTVSEVNATLTGLNAGTTVYYRIVSTNINGTVAGETQSFTTQATTGLTLNPIDLHFAGAVLTNSQITGTASATVNGNTVNVPGTYSFTSDAGTTLAVGSTQENVVFTPTDLVHFTDASATTTVDVSPTAPALSASQVATPYTGTAHPSGATLSGVLPADEASLAPLVQVRYKNIATGDANSSAPVAPGRYEVFASFAGNNDYSAIAEQDTGVEVSIDPFSQLPTPSARKHQTRQLFKGDLATPSLAAGGTVTIEVAGMARYAKVNKNGIFHRRFPLARLAAGTYPVQYTYNSSTAPATTWNSTLIVTT